MRKNLIFSSLAMMIAMSETGLSSSPEKPIVRRGNPIPTNKKKYIFNIPKNCKLYLFDYNGNFESYAEFLSRDKMPDYCVFYTISINNKTAIKKYKKWFNKELIKN